MIARGQVFVRALIRAGGYGSVDVLDLDDESFRAWVVGMLVRAGIATAIVEPEGDAVELHERED